MLLGRPQDKFSNAAIHLLPVFVQLMNNIHALTSSTTVPGATTNTTLTWGSGNCGNGSEEKQVFDDQELNNHFE